MTDCMSDWLDQHLAGNTRYPPRVTKHDGEWWVTCDNCAHANRSSSTFDQGWPYWQQAVQSALFHGKYCRSPVIAWRPSTRSSG